MIFIKIIVGSPSSSSQDCPCAADITLLQCVSEFTVFLFHNLSVCCSFWQVSPGFSLSPPLPITFLLFLDFSPSITILWKLFASASPVIVSLSKNHSCPLIKTERGKKYIFWHLFPALLLPSILNYLEESIILPSGAPKLETWWDWFERTKSECLSKCQSMCIWEMGNEAES